VDERLIRLNVMPLAGTSPTEYLLYSDALPRRNDGRISDTLLKRYAHTERGGWWCSGIDLLTGKTDLWGCFKPQFPRISSERGKPIKYEHPPKIATGVFALRVPPHLWQRIADRGQAFTIPQEGEPAQVDGEFWEWLIQHPEIPLCITEGAKKAGALLTAGYAAIALPGIHNGYRTPRDSDGKRTGKSNLIPQLQKLAVPGREIYIAFDCDTKAATVQAVNTAIRRLGYLLVQAGCAVRVVTWNPQLGKGADDFIASQGEAAFHQAYDRALPLDTWKAAALSCLTHAASLQLDCRYLPPLVIPETAKLIGIKSAKGTGKTRLLEQIVRESLAQNRAVLVIGHRIKLVEELCQRFGLQYVTELQANPASRVRGYGLCVDSLHGNSQAKFKAADWSNATIIIDEVEQVIWHTLNSETCRNNRVAILKSLKTLMQDVLGGEGRVFVADADLSDTSLDYLLALAGIPLQPFVVHNTWKPREEEAWKIYNYAGNNPKELVSDLVAYIRDGGKPFVCLSAQKLTSQWGTQTLESYFKKQFPDKNILRLDAESLAEPNHPAYACINHLNSVLTNYDIVLASPAIETGVSIDIKGHFTSVWCIAQGVQSATSVCQALGRIRENIPRYIWAASYGFNQVGNGSTSIPALLTSGHRLTELNIRLLQQSDFASIDDLDTGFQAESLLCWAKMAVRINASMIEYRGSILALLQEEGHCVFDSSLADFCFYKNNHEERQKIAHNQSNYNTKSNRIATPETNSSEAISNQLSEIINAVKEQNYQAECEAIAAAADLSEEQHQSLKKRLVKTIVERRCLKKHELFQRYNIPVTAQLVTLDDRDWHRKIRLHYFLTIGRQHLAKRDAIIAQQLVNQGDGSLFLPDFNESQLGAAIGTMEALGIPILLANPERKLSSKDRDLQHFLEIALNNRSEIKTVMGIGIALNASPITIVRRFLDKIGCSLVCTGTERIEKKTVRIYQVTVPNDGRKKVFQQWLIRDKKCSDSSKFNSENYRKNQEFNSHFEPAESSGYVQLSLKLG
jgi:hypothetical protein